MPPLTFSQVLATANSQHGVVSRLQLLEMGLTSDWVDSGLSLGRLTSIYPGVYAVGHSRLTVQGQWMAGVLAGGRVAALSHRCAAAHWGLIRPPPVIEVLRAWGPKRDCEKTTQAQAPFGRPLKIRRSRVFGPDEFVVRNAIRTTSVARMFLDLASIFDERRLDSAMTEAERLGIIEMKPLKEVTCRGRGWTGVGKLRRVVAAWDPNSIDTRSELEIEFLRLCRVNRIPTPEVNVMVGGMEVDCFWRDRSLVVELDGFRYHRSPMAMDRDKEKTLRLEEQGVRVARLSHKMVTQEQSKTAARLKTWLN